MCQSSAKSALRSQRARSTSAGELADRAKAEQFFESGATKSSNGDKAGAIADYTRAITLDPKNVNAYNNRGTEKQNAGDISGAIADFSRAIEINPREAGSLLQPGRDLFSQTRLEEGSLRSATARRTKPRG
jgi:tetratricopeptide (TPR) repeat protein